MKYAISTLSEVLSLIAAIARALSHAESLLALEVSFLARENKFALPW
jgi:hypothetical protein